MTLISIRVADQRSTRATTIRFSAQQEGLFLERLKHQSSAIACHVCSHVSGLTWCLFTAACVHIAMIY